MPSKVSVDKIKANLLQPALTSHFIVDISTPPSSGNNSFDDYLKGNGVIYNQEKLRLLCSEATLPGSSLATHENNSDFTGVTEKFAYRRLYDDRIDFTFYVDVENYLPIRFFETWIKYIVGESISAGPGRVSSKKPEYFYRVRYPKEYISEQGLRITKFERTSKSKTNSNHEGNTLIYNFINSYPLSVTSMPVSYDASSLLKCTVSFSYIRYYVESKDYPSTSESSSRSSNSAADSPRATTGAQLDAIEAADIAYTEALKSRNNDAIEAADIEYTKALRAIINK
jgi:hypothetical protein